MPSQNVNLKEKQTNTIITVEQDNSVHDISIEVSTVMVPEFP